MIRRSGFWVYMVFGAVAFCLSLAFSLGVFREVPLTGDEGSYLFQAHCFLDGVLKRACPPFWPMLTYDMIILRPEAGWFSRYPPGHVLWLLPGVAVGFPHLMSAAAASVTVVGGGIAGRALGLPRSLMPLLLILSPFFLFLHGTLLSHTSGLAAATLLLMSYVLWRKTERDVWAVVAGCCWAFLFLNRTWTALLIALPYALDALAALVAGRTHRRVWRQTCLFAGMAALGPVLYLIYNALQTGDPGLPTYLYYEASEGLGFGPRRTQGDEVVHTLSRGVSETWVNLRLLDRWLFGVPGMLLLVMISAAVGWSRRWTPVLLGQAATVVTGYVFFWYPGIRDLGPVYYSEVLPALLLGGSFGVLRAGRWVSTRFRPTVAGMLVVGCLGFGAVHFCLDQGAALRTLLGPRYRLLSMLDQLPENSLVIQAPPRIHAKMEERWLHKYYALNLEGLNSDPLLLKALPDYAVFLADSLPRRNQYVMEYDGAEISLNKYDPDSTIHLKAANGHYMHSAARTFNDQRHSEEDRHAAGVMYFGRYLFLPPGDYLLRADLEYEAVHPDRPVVVDVASELGRSLVGRRECTGSGTGCLLEFSVSSITEVEPRVAYGGSGSVQLRSLELKRIH